VNTTYENNNFVQVNIVLYDRMFGEFIWYTWNCWSGL